MESTAAQAIEKLKRDSEALDRLNASVPVRGKRERVQLPGRTIETVFYPAPKHNAPLVFAFHGGGFVLGGCALDDNLYWRLSRELEANIVSVGYRKGERNPHPNPANDAYDTVMYYVSSCGKDYDFDCSKIAAFGASAGGNLAIATSILAHRRKEIKIGMQIVAYPFVDSASPPEAKGFSPEELPVMRYFNEAHASPRQWTDPLVSPILARDSDFDPALRVVVILADKDRLWHEGEIYAHRLNTLGIAVAKYVAQGQGHGFFEYAFRESLEGYITPDIQAAAADGSLYRERDVSLEFIKEHWTRWLAR